MAKITIELDEDDFFDGYARVWTLTMSQNGVRQRGDNLEASRENLITLTEFWLGMREHKPLTAQERKRALTFRDFCTITRGDWTYQLTHTTLSSRLNEREKL